MKTPNAWDPLLQLRDVVDRERARLKADNENMRKQIAGLNAEDEVKATQKLKAMAAKASRL